MRRDPGNLFVELTGKVFRFVEYNHGAVIGLALAGMLAGCDVLWPVTAPSPTTGKPITQDQLQQELNATIRERDNAVAEMLEQSKALAEKAARYDADTGEVVAAYGDANEQINDRREQRGKVLNSIASFAGTVNPAAGTALSLLLAGGLGYDNVRKSLSIRRARKGK